MQIPSRKRNTRIASTLAFLMSCVLTVSGSFAGSNEVNFSITDIPGRWFDTGIDIAGTRSLAIVTPGAKINF